MEGASPVGVQASGSCAVVTTSEAYTMDDGVKDVGVQDASCVFVRHADGMVLPFDILFELFQWLWTPDISRLMRTCKTMYARGAYAILAQGGLWIASGELNSLGLFLKADLARCKYPCSLNITYLRGKREKGARLLTYVLQQASNIREVFAIGNTLTQLPELTMVIARMRTIEDLKLDSWHDGAASLLANIESPIRRLEVHFSPRGEDWGVGNFTNLLPHLVRLQDSLEELVAVWPNWSRIPTGMQLPRVRRLEIISCDGYNITTLIRVFPNVRNLEIYADEELHTLSMTGGPERIRMHNIVGQQRLGTWTKVEYAYITAYTLYVLAPICKIKTLRTDDPHCSFHGHVPLNCWQDTLAATRLENLDLFIDNEESVGRMDEVLDAIPNTVRKLRLQITLHDWEIPMEDTFDTLRRGLASLTSVTHLHCTFDWSDCPRDTPDIWSLAITPEYYQRKASFLEFDRLAYTCTVAVRMTSLEYIRMEIWPDGSDPNTLSDGEVWAMTIVDGEHCLTGLSEEEGLRVMKWD